VAGDVTSQFTFTFIANEKFTPRTTSTATNPRSIDTVINIRLESNQDVQLVNLSTKTLATVRA
jgi:hypothetical protein